MLAADASVVCNGDTGDTVNSSYNNSRIVRINTNACEFTSYGAEGTGTRQFDNPVILGSLPKVYDLAFCCEPGFVVDGSASIPG